MKKQPFAQIKTGAVVGMDHRQWAWPNLPNVSDPNMTFTVDIYADTSRLRAPGFGLKFDYGSGSLWVKKEDLVESHA